MRRLLPFILMLSLPPILTGCGNLMPEKKLDKRVTLRRSDKIPYGTYVAYEHLRHLFPSAAVNINKLSPSSYKSFAAGYSSYDSDDTSSVLYMIISPTFDPDKREYDALMRFVSHGNHVFISAQRWGSQFTDSLNVDISHFYRFSDTTGYPDSLQVSVFNVLNHDAAGFTYPGSNDLGYIDDYDPAHTRVLGYNGTGNPNFIKIAYQGGGSIYLHTNPLALTNFFLLHKSNSRYYDQVLSYIQPGVTQIEWDEYFRYGRQFSAWQVIMNNPSLSAAFWLTMLIFLLIFLFDSKRKQRIIPGIPPLRNASLDFVKTVGRLYYQYHDNRNLGLKMIAHLMDHIRRRYNLSTLSMDDRFVEALAYKSGYDPAALRKIFYHAKWIQDNDQVSDEELMEFNRLTDAFYKHL